VASLSALWSALPSGSLWVRVAPASLSAAAGTRLPLLPARDRTDWTFDLGVVVPGEAHR
jgi:hypothetical protein